MGVHDLETFIKSKVPNGFRDINLMMEIMRFKRTNFKRPILIFDVMAIVGYLCENKIEILCGGCFNSYTQHLEEIFSELAKDCELFFFMDGFVQMDSKFSTWKKRQDDKYKKNMSIMNEIYERRPLDEIARSHHVYVNTVLVSIEKVAIKYGTLKYAVNFECDKEIAQFAAQHWRVLAIFSDDSDYLIFAGAWRYFSMKSFDSVSLHVDEYNRKALRSFLKLNEFQMSCLATCLGNDIICHTSLKSFHRKFESKIIEIAEFIRSNIAGLKTHSDVLEFIVKSIFGAHNDHYMDLINTSINSYSICYQNDTFEGQFDYLLVDHMLFTHNVLAGAPFNFSLIFYDLQKHPRSYFDVSIEMFKRQAGIVFAQAGIDPFQLEVFTKRSHTKSHEMIAVDPIMPPFEVPSMQEIQSGDSQLDALRYKLLAWSISHEKLANFNLRQIPKKFMIDILTLVYLVHNVLITSKEADLILFSISRTQQKNSNCYSRPPNKLDPRAFHVAFLFTKMWTNIARSIEVCGLKKKYDRPLAFNGFDFHNLFIKYKNFDFDLNAIFGKIKLNN